MATPPCAVGSRYADGNFLLLVDPFRWRTHNCSGHRSTGAGLLPCWCYAIVEIPRRASPGHVQAESSSRSHPRRMEWLFTAQNFAPLDSLTDIVWGNHEPIPVETFRAVAPQLYAIVTGSWRFGIECDHRLPSCLHPQSVCTQSRRGNTFPAQNYRAPAAHWKCWIGCVHQHCSCRAATPGRQCSGANY